MAQYEDLIIDKGTDVIVRLECYNPDGSEKVFNTYDSDVGAIISVYTINAKIKKSYSTLDSDAIIFTTSTLDDTSLNNIITLQLSNAQTDAMKAGDYVYDVEIETWDSDLGATIVERILEGKVSVTPSVS